MLTLVPVAVPNVRPDNDKLLLTVRVPVELRYNPVSPKKIPPAAVVDAASDKIAIGVLVPIPTKPLHLP